MKWNWVVLTRPPGLMDSTNNLECSASDQQRCCKCAAKKNKVNIGSACQALLPSVHRIDVLASSCWRATAWLGIRYRSHFVWDQTPRSQSIELGRCQFPKRLFIREDGGSLACLFIKFGLLCDFGSSQAAIDQVAMSQRTSSAYAGMRA